MQIPNDSAEKTISLEVGTVGDFVAFNINAKAPVEFPLVVKLKITEALAVISGISAAITIVHNTTQSELIQDT